jgi:Icc-related predicted phosphoesterase
MRLLLFSDLHRDVESARSIVARAHEADVLVGAGDFAVKRRGIDDVIDVLREVDRPCVLVPGNGENDSELVDACAGWDMAHVLHGSGVQIDGVDFFGLGAAIPVTPFGPWSFDLSEAEAEQMLSECPDRAVLVSHSPPFGYADASGEQHLGSRAVRAALERTQPRLVVCGHIHASWGVQVSAGATLVVNAGPAGLLVDLT